ncbi:MULTISPECIES: cupin domain-containing protein [Alphaproteobacteria]|uniref:(R)-mandelonitrile lyase n=1 Tax=Alphaproteobacteria TaxID=28211 RepID=UPI003A8EAECC
MRSHLAIASALTFLAVPALAQTNSDASVTRSGSQPATLGSSEYFTGQVRVEDRFASTDPATVRGATVVFEPGARSAWHTHPLGQILIVTNGVGHVQVAGHPVQTIRPGDVVVIPANAKHWHGASADNGMSHIAFSETQDGKSVTWMEQVSDEQYGAR